MSFDLSAWGDLFASTFDGLRVVTNNVVLLAASAERASAIDEAVRAQVPQTPTTGSAFVFRGAGADAVGAGVIRPALRKRITRMVAMGRANARRDAALREAIVALLPADPFSGAKSQVIVVGGITLDTRYLAPLRGMGAVSVTCEDPGNLNSVVVFDDGDVALVLAPLDAGRVTDVVVLGRFKLPQAGAL